MDESPTITCSATEATFLASLVGGKALVGMRDPFLGWLTEEILESWEQARRALSERRYIAVEPDGRIVLDTAVAALVSTWASPDASFILNVTRAGEANDVRYFHLTRYLAVEQCLASESHYQLTALENGSAVFERIVQLLSLSHQPSAPGSRALATNDVLTRVRSIATVSGSAQAAAEMQQAGATTSAAQALGETLAHPIMNGALVALAQGQTAWQVCGLGLLEGTNGLWRLRSYSRDSETWVEALPCDAKQARAEIRRVMNRVLLEPLPDK